MRTAVEHRSISDFQAILPDEAEEDGYTIRLNQATSVTGSKLWSAVVVISPAMNEEPDLMIGLGANIYEAIADAFARARKRIRERGAVHLNPPTV